MQNIAMCQQTRTTTITNQPAQPSISSRRFFSALIIHQAIGCLFLLTNLTVRRRGDSCSSCLVIRVIITYNCFNQEIYYLLVNPVSTLQAQAGTSIFLDKLERQSSSLKKEGQRAFALTVFFFLFPTK